MKRFLKIFIPIIILGALWYQFREPLSLRILPILEGLIKLTFSGSCDEPIPYKLGVFAKEFKISEKYFKEAIAEAEAIWEDPFGKNLFVYAAENTSRDVLKINLIYDYRQQTTSKLVNLGGTLSDTKYSYDSLKSKLTKLQAAYQENTNIFNDRVSAFNQTMKDYQEKVEYWNKKGGAPQKEYDEIQATRSQLQQEAKDLEATEQDLNEQENEINSLVTELNRLAKTLNLSVEKYNTINEARGESFEEGLYVSQGEFQEINIYEFSDRDKLVRVLAHELGHALGLPHVADPKAIMYELNEDDNTALTVDDFNALQVKCAE